MTKSLIFKNLPPAVCIPWDQKLKEVGEVRGDADQVKKEWENLDMFGNLYIWNWVQR